MEKISFNGRAAARGSNFTKARGWRLLATKGRLRYWVGTIIANKKIGEDQILVFKVRRN